MASQPKLLDQFNPLAANMTDEKLFIMFLDAANAGVMETFRLMPLEKQKKFLNLKDTRKGNAERTALITASFNGKDEVVAHLLSLKADTEIVDKQGWTALAAAAWKGHDIIVTSLLDANAKIDARDSENWTALHDALNNGNWRTVLLLLSRGANPTLKNSDGMNALDIARDIKLHQVIPALEELVTKYTSDATVKAMGHITRDLPAPEKARFRSKKHEPRQMRRLRQQ